MTDDVHAQDPDEDADVTDTNSGLIETGGSDVADANSGLVEPADIVPSTSEVEDAD